MSGLKFIELRSSAALPCAEQIAALRIKIFSDWPYLYSGDLKYELKYLQTYFSSEKSFIILAIDGERVVGASTAIWLPHAEVEFQTPFIERGIATAKVCYYGESVLLQEYRGFGAGRRFMQARENFARSLQEVTSLAFCAVIRPKETRPIGYRTLSDFWYKEGFVPAEGMIAYFKWRDVDSGLETEKGLQFWLKDLA